MKLSPASRVGTVLLLFFVLLGACARPGVEPADLVVTNGRGA